MLSLPQTSELQRMPRFTGHLVASSVHRFAFALLPTFVQCKLRPARSGTAVKAPERLGDTAWMDGIRGCMSLVVITAHQLQPYNMCPSPVFAGSRILFFVLGGFVASHKAQTAMTAGATQAALAGLAKSAFRKCSRIYLPVFVTTLLIALLAQAGAYESIRPWMGGGVDKSGKYFGQSWGPRIVPIMPSMRKQLEFWYKEGIALVNVWQTDGYAHGEFKHQYPLHNGFLWTLKEELRAAFSLYLSLLLSAFMKPMARLGTLAILTQYHIYGGRWECTIYTFGAMLAQCDISFFQPLRRASLAATVHSAGYLPLPSSSPILAEKAVLPELQPASSNRLSRTLQRMPLRLRSLIGWILWVALLLFSLSLLSFPSRYRKQYPLYWRHVLDAVPWWWCEKEKTVAGFGWGLFVIVMQTASPTSLLHRFLNNSLLRYAGSQFFGLLCSHWIVLCMGGYWLHNLGWHILGGSWKCRDSRFWIGWSFGWTLNLLLCSWAADVWTREIFRRSNRFAHWIEQKMFVPPPAPSASP